MSRENPSRRKKSRAETHARLEYSQSELEIAPYLLVDGAAAGALVEAPPAGGSSLLQPVSIMPIARPSSTIRVDILFIGTRNLYQNPKPDKQNIHPIYK